MAAQKKQGSCRERVLHSTLAPGRGLRQPSRSVQSIKEFRRARRWHFLGAILILAACAGLAGLEGTRAQPVDGVAAIVNDRVITFSEVKKEVEPAEKLLRESYSGQELVDKVKQARLGALKTLIERELIVQDFNKQGFFIPDSYIEDRVKDVVKERFDGDRTVFIKTLLANGLSLDQYKQELKRQTIVQAMRSKNVSSAVVVSPYRIEQYYQENIQRFMQPEQVHVRLIFLKKAILPQTRKKADGSDETFDPQAELMKDITYKLDTGADFGELARSYSEGPKRDEGGDLGWVSKETLRGELAPLAFQLRPGQRSAMVTTDDGYYVLKVEDVRKPAVQPLSEVRDDIEKNLIQEERQRLQQEWLDSLRAKAFIKMF